LIPERDRDFSLLHNFQNSSHVGGKEMVVRLTIHLLEVSKLKMHGSTSISPLQDFKIRRLEWAGHIIRMEEERIPKKVLNGNFHTTNQWEDQEQDGQMWFRGMHCGCWG
jgi:hypothetical protein